MYNGFNTNTATQIMDNNSYNILNNRYFNRLVHNKCAIGEFAIVTETKAHGQAHTHTHAPSTTRMLGKPSILSSFAAVFRIECLISIKIMNEIQ